jgi:hypothetical protein
MKLFQSKSLLGSVENYRRAQARAPLYISPSIGASGRNRGGSVDLVRVLLLCPSNVQLSSKVSQLTIVTYSNHGWIPNLWQI